MSVLLWLPSLSPKVAPGRGPILTPHALTGGPGGSVGNAWAQMVALVAFSFFCPGLVFQHLASNFQGLPENTYSNAGFRALVSR